jgi:hypothetical protein
MIQDTRGWLNIHDVARERGIELSNEQAWAWGSGMRGVWLWEVGTPPLKELRSKRDGTGSHCFALYPPSWRPRMERWLDTVVRAAEAKAEQMEMAL